VSRLRRGSSRFPTASSFRTRGEPDETPADARTTPITHLADETLLFLVPSRYCDSDKLADFAWSQFGKLPGGARCAQAICDFVHSKIRFSYADARSTRCASDSMHEGVGVCRDFAHLAGFGSVIGIVFGTITFAIVNQGIYYTNFDRNLSSLIIGVMLLIAVLMNNTFRKMAVNYVGRKPAVTFAVAKKGIA
jgi:hypothetical protein